MGAREGKDSEVLAQDFWTPLPVTLSLYVYIYIYVYYCYSYCYCYYYHYISSSIIVIIVILYYVVLVYVALPWPAPGSPGHARGRWARQEALAGTRERAMTQVYMHTSLSLSLSLSIHIYIYMYVYIHTYIYIYIYNGYLYSAVCRIAMAQNAGRSPRRHQLSGAVFPISSPPSARNQPRSKVHGWLPDLECHFDRPSFERDVQRWRAKSKCATADDGHGRGETGGHTGRPHPQ